MNGIEKTIRPQLGVNTLTIAFATGKQDAECWKVFVLAPQPIAQPRTHTGPVALLRSDLEQGQCGNPVMSSAARFRSRSASAISLGARFRSSRVRRMKWSISLAGHASSLTSGTSGLTGGTNAQWGS